MTKAGYNFVCACCEEVRPEQEVHNDKSLGPVCGPCNYFLLNAEAALIRHGIKRPVTIHDVRENEENNPHNNRFESYGL